MTVQELLEILNAVPDKKREVLIKSICCLDHTEEWKFLETIDNDIMYLSEPLEIVDDDVGVPEDSKKGILLF